ncbi:MAG: radical SAM protein [Planctomycetes bacterium]|nr:radical SAM protein [Planctomycetota bacterium]
MSSPAPDPSTPRPKKRSRIREYLDHPLLSKINAEIEKGVARNGKMRSISLNMTKVCNIRCEGCYFFGQGLDQYAEIKDVEQIQEFIRKEKERGTNTITLVGGEPSLYMDRVKLFYEHFNLYFVVNGLRPVPYEGFEDMNIAVSVWGDHEYDKQMRGSGKIDIFAKALKNFAHDPRVHYYFTVAHDKAHMIEPVVEEIVAHGNRVFFSYYGHVEGISPEERDAGFAQVRAEIDRMIERHPDRILTTSYLSLVGTTQKLYDDTWGYDVCPNISQLHPDNQERLQNGKPYNVHFRPYNTDMETTSRCCMGDTLTCDDCYNIWPHTTWVMINQRKHMRSLKEFGYWMTSCYVFYLLTRWVDFDRAIELLPEIHEFQKELREMEVSA